MDLRDTCSDAGVPKPDFNWRLYPGDQSQHLLLVFSVTARQVEMGDVLDFFSKPGQSKEDYTELLRKSGMPVPGRVTTDDYMRRLIEKIYEHTKLNKGKYSEVKFNCSINDLVAIDLVPGGEAFNKKLLEDFLLWFEYPVPRWTYHQEGAYFTIA